MKVLNAALMLLAFSFFAEPVVADSSDIALKAEVDQAFITIGDPVEYTVTLRHKPSIQILSTIPAPSKDVFKVKNVKDISNEEDGLIITGKKFIVTTYTLGEFVLEPVRIQFREDGGPVEFIETESIYIRVKSIAEGEPKSDIRGAKGVVAIPKNVLLIVILLTVAAILVIGWLLYHHFKNKGAQQVQVEPALSPEDEAFFRLNKLFDSDLIRKDKHKEYYFILSEILRGYFERRFKIQAVESTTFEIMRFLKQKEIDRPLRERIHEVLEAADLAKFAKWRPEPQQIVQYNQKAKEVIAQSKPTFNRKEATESGV